LTADIPAAQRELDKMQRIILLDLFDMANVLTYRMVFYPHDFVRETSTGGNTGMTCQKGIATSHKAFLRNVSADYSVILQIKMHLQSQPSNRVVTFANHHDL